MAAAAAPREVAPAAAVAAAPREVAPAAAVHSCGMRFIVAEQHNFMNDGSAWTVAEQFENSAGHFGRVCASACGLPPGGGTHIVTDESLHEQQARLGRRDFLHHRF